MAINVKNKIKVLGIILFGIFAVSLASCGSDTEVKGDNIIVTENGTKTIENKNDKEESNTQNKENNVTNNESNNQNENQTETKPGSQTETQPKNQSTTEPENQTETQPENQGGENQNTGTETPVVIKLSILDEDDDSSSWKGILF